jgi:hypothetical protein
MAEQGWGHKGPGDGLLLLLRLLRLLLLPPPPAAAGSTDQNLNRTAAAASLVPVGRRVHSMSSPAQPRPGGSSSRPAAVCMRPTPGAPHHRPAKPLWAAGFKAAGASAPNQPAAMPTPHTQANHASPQTQLTSPGVARRAHQFL